MVALLDLRRGCQRASTGASPLHGGHHDAQKFSTTTFPLYDDSVTGQPPLRGGSLRFGGTGRFPAASCESIDWLVWFCAIPYPSRASSASTAAMTTSGTGRRRRFTAVPEGTYAALRRVKRG